MLAVVSLAFIGIFAFTYMHADQSREVSEAAGSLAAGPPELAEQRDRGMPERLGIGGEAAIASTIEPARTVINVTDNGRPRFKICHSGGGTNCAVDGDTAWIAGEKIRIADIDAPETHPPRCASEAELGDRATRRLAELMSAGPFDQQVGDRNVDRYGRKLRILVRDGRSLGDQLVSEGLARRWEGRRKPWC